MYTSTHMLDYVCICVCVWVHQCCLSLVSRSKAMCLLLAVASALSPKKTRTLNITRGDVCWSRVSMLAIRPVPVGEEGPFMGTYETWLAERAALRGGGAAWIQRGRKVNAEGLEKTRGREKMDGKGKNRGERNDAENSLERNVDDNVRLKGGSGRWSHETRREKNTSFKWTEPIQHVSRFTVRAAVH